MSNNQIGGSTRSTRRGSLLPARDTTRAVSHDPHIVCADSRYEPAPHFLYLPPGRGDMVLVDYPPNIHAAASWPVWQTHPHPERSYEAPFLEQEIEGKGVGLVANRVIAAGELIYSERPIYAARNPVSCASDQTDANGIFYRAALQGLSDDSITKFSELENAYPPDFDVAPGILNTNCLKITISGSDGHDDYRGCFPTLSRINHDCRPNAHYFFDQQSFEGQIRATREIHPGHEITITYTRLDAPRRVRQNELLKTRYFLCACRTCSLPPNGQNESDARRERVRILINQLEGIQFPPRIPLDRLLKALESAGDEGLTVEYAKILLLGSQVLAIYDDAEVASEWARRARQLYTRIDGERSDVIRELDRANRVLRTMTANGTPGPLRG